MNKKELKQKIEEMINSGKSKEETFQRLVAKGENTRTVATLIASYQNLNNYEKNYSKVNTLITVMFIWALFNAFSGYFAGLEISIPYAWFMAFIAAIIPLMYAYGFYKNHVKAYNIFIALGLVSIGFVLLSFMKLPFKEAAISLTVNIVMLAHVWYVRSLLFPDFYILGPKKVNGQYVFTS